MPWRPRDLPPDPEDDENLPVEPEPRPVPSPLHPWGPALLLTSRCLRWGWRV